MRLGRILVYSSPGSASAFTPRYSAISSTSSGESSPGAILLEDRSMAGEMAT